MPSVTFYFDLGSPYAYLAAERIETVLLEPIRWQPILLGGLFKLTGRSSWALGDYRRREAGMAQIEQRARSYGLPAVHWPDPWPADYLLAMRTATFAFTVQRGREFAMQALRDAFQRGRDLSVRANVMHAAEQAGLDIAEVQEAIGDPQIKRALREATDAAHELGVFGVPTVAIDKDIFWGDDRIEDAAARLSARRVR
ncbi:MAG TPA: DsbA family protein [Solirubrobacteraceae bacterium]|nr:DsbA family protein [Solirubrobacteraceae bacterium]